MTSHICQNYSTKMEPAVNRLVNLHLHASYTYLFLGYYFDQEGVGYFFRELAEEKFEGTQHLLKLQNDRGGALFRKYRGHLKMREVNPGGHGSCLGSGELKPGPLRSSFPGFCSHRPYLFDSLENHFLDEEVKHIKKMGSQVTSICSPAGPQSPLGEYLFEHLTLKHD